MEYQATFGIDGGVSQGFGVTYPDYTKRTETLSADNPQSAHQNAMTMARKFANDYLSNPDTDFTTVQLLSLKGPNGKVSFNVSKSVAKQSTLEHLLALYSKSEPDEKF